MASKASRESLFACLSRVIYRDVLKWKARGRGTPLQEANRSVPLDGIAFSRLEWVAFSIDLLEWGRKFSDFWGK